MTAGTQPLPSLDVEVETGTGQPLRYSFQSRFTVGRNPDCDVCLPSTYVSRVHIEAQRVNGVWSLRDLGSSNGTFIEGQKVVSVVLAQPITARLGKGGPLVRFSPGGSAGGPALQQPPPLAESELQSVASETSLATANQATGAPPHEAPPTDIGRYFRESAPGEQAGPHTILVRRAISQVRARQNTRWQVFAAGLMLVLLAVSLYALRQLRQVKQQRQIAESIFYSIRALDVDIANFEQSAAEDPASRARLRSYREKRRGLERQYDQFLSTMKFNSKNMTPERRLILRVARVFGECELTMPPSFEDEIRKYIRRWQSTGRFARAVKLAREKGYTRRIAQELLDRDLPPQFFYLALQESDFDPYISGPPTRLGIAKGMWQFIPQTAAKYGMKVGALAEFRRPDPGDDRHHWEIETTAAARYMKDLYGSEAQSSGLLIMACYNWGEDRVLPLVRSLPANPQSRNFWQLLARYKDKVPQETYDYVFAIVSAAVIGEDPRLFGFDFDNPLADVIG